MEKNACCCTNSNQQPQKDIILSTPASSMQVTRKSASAVPSVFLSILIAFFPKCPICWAAYMSMFGSIGLARLPYMGWLLPVLLFFLGLHLLLLYRKIPQRGYLPFLTSLCGAILVLTARYLLPDEKWLLFTGMGLVIAGSLLNSLSFIRLPLLQQPANQSNLHQ